MIDPNTLVTDGVVRVATSLYPTQLQVDSMGSFGTRVLIIDDTEGGWILGAWRANPAGGQPVQVVFEKIQTIHKYATRMIDVTLVDGRRAQITPDKGCACGGSNIRNYNPFGASTNLARVPAPEAVAA